MNSLFEASENVQRLIDPNISVTRWENGLGQAVREASLEDLEIALELLPEELAGSRAAVLKHAIRMRRKNENTKD